MTNDIALVSDEDCIEVIYNTFPDTKDERLYIRRKSNQCNIGDKGLYGYQLPSNGVNNPRMYAIELYTLANKRTKMPETFIIYHLLDQNGNLDKPCIDVIRKEMNVIKALVEAKNGIKINNGDIVVAMDGDFNTVQLYIADFIKQRNTQVEY